MATKLKAFTVYAKVTIECGITIKAESFEDALERSKELKEADFVDVFQDYNDGSLEITGVFKS